MSQPLEKQLSQILPAIRQHLRLLNLRGLWIDKNDCHNSEYGDPEDNYLSFVTGFMGSQGLALILMDRAYIFVDGRYTLQAAKEVDLGTFEIKNYKRKFIQEFCEELNLKDEPIGFLSTALTLEQFGFYKELCDLRAMDETFLSSLWQDRPEKKYYPISDYPITFSGKSRDTKIQDLQTACQKAGVDGVFLNESNGIAWLLNIRSVARPITPAPHTFAYIPQKGKPILWAHRQEWPKATIGDIDWRSYDQAMIDMQEIAKNQTLWIDRDNISYAHAQGFYEAGIKCHSESLPIERWKALKNDVEIEGAREIHRRDGAALCQFMAWLEGQDPGNLSEMDVVEKILGYRQGQTDFKGISFDTIAGFGPRGAIIHYHPTPENHGRLGHENILLLDSGGQYFGGTTDVTRTIYLGSKPTAQQKEHYTRVLKGHIALASAQFKIGTSGSELDSLARKPLKEVGLDYAHGTGHGVGSYLGVHEGPQNISTVPNHVPLEIGMIVSNEPGYYLEGSYGIRIESLLLVQESSNSGYLCFETLTLAPLEQKLIDHSMLDESEIGWLRAYHKRILDEISPRVDGATQTYLKSFGGF